MISSAFSIAVAQACPVAGNVAANVLDHVRLAETAAAQGARLVLFPELSLTGYELTLADNLAFSEVDARLEPLRTLAGRRGITLVVGAPIRLAGALHIGAFIIEPGGELQIYAKQRLGAFAASAVVDGTVPPREDSVFAPGDRSPLFTLAETPAVVAICADIGEPAHAARAADSGAKAYLASMFVIPSEFDGDASRLAGYARDHGMVVAMANYGALTGGLASAGRSSIWSERGELLARLDAAGAGVAIATRTAAGWRTMALSAAAVSGDSDQLKVSER